MIWFIPLFMAWASRWAGGGWPHVKVPGTARKIIAVLPYGLLHPLCLIPAAIAKCTGHGRGISLEERLRGKPEKVEMATLWLEPHISVYWYKVAILAATGLLGSVPAGIIYGWHAGALYGLILALGGLFKPLAYMLGWKWWIIAPTAAGEILTGFFSGLVIAGLLAVG